MILVAEKEIAGFYILVDNIVVMAICQSGCSLQGNTAELVEIAIKVILVQGIAPEIFHQFIVTTLTVNVRLAIVVYPDDHLHIDILDDAHQGLLDGEVGIVYLQHSLAFLTFYQEYLSFARIIAQALDTTIDSSFKQELNIPARYFFRRITWPNGCIASSRLVCRDTHRRVDSGFWFDCS